MHLEVKHTDRGFVVTFNHTGMPLGSMLFRADTSDSRITEGGVGHILRRMVNMHNVASGMFADVDALQEQRDTALLGMDIPEAKGRVIPVRALPLPLLDLHAHAGHHLTIGHDGGTFKTTLLWCDTCDRAVLAVPNDTGCEDHHLEPV